MSGPNPPGPEPGELDAGSESGDSSAAAEERACVSTPAAPGAGDGTDDDSELHSRAYSAPEAEQFVSGPYVPADLALYDYDSYTESPGRHEEPAAARWPWVVGVAAIVAAIALVVSVSLLVARTDTNKLAAPGTATPALPPLQDALTAKTAPPSPGPPATESPAPPPTETVTVTSPAPPPPSSTSAPPEQTSAAPTTTAAAVVPPTTSTIPAGPRQVTYAVTGTKAPGDIISVTYIDASGRRRTQHNVYIPWSMTVTPISQSDVGSVEASSLFRVSRLNCSITTSDGTVLSSNTNDAPTTSC